MVGALLVLAVVHMTSGWDWFYFAMIVVSAFSFGAMFGGRKR